MLERLTVRGFKSLREVTIEPGRHLTVLFGANAAGKSNLVEAMAALPNMARGQALHDALDGPFPIRGQPFEAFAFPAGGLPALLQSDGPDPTFSIDAEVVTADGSYRYRIETRLALSSGYLAVEDEYLIQTGPRRSPKPTIEREDSRLRIRTNGRTPRPNYGDLGSSRSVLSDRDFSGPGYARIDALRRELLNWRIYTPEPGSPVRSPRGPADVSDIGVYGQSLAPFLYKLRALYPDHYESLVFKVRGLVPAAEDVALEVHPQRGTLDIRIRQGGIEYSTDLLSDGTLRILALCAISVNPWQDGGVVTIEEPENGVHPRRLEDIARLLLSLGQHGGQQVIVTTHSPLFVQTILQARNDGGDPSGVRILNVRHDTSEPSHGTAVDVFEIPDALLEDAELTRALSYRGEEGLFEGLLLRGYIDE